MHEAKTHLGDEYLLIKEGELTVRFESEEHELVSGDALHFSGNTSHSYINSSVEEASFFFTYALSRIMKKERTDHPYALFLLSCVGLFFFHFFVFHVSNTYNCNR